LGRKWEFTFNHPGSFSAEPSLLPFLVLFYEFGGAYWVWIAILFCFTVQAVSYEFRSKPNNFLGKRVYESFLFFNGLVGTILLGAAVSTFFTGSLFSVNKLNITDPGNPVISQWETPWHGLEAILNVQNVVLGLAVFFLARTMALMYFLKNIGEESIILRTRRHLWYNAIPFLILFVLFVVLLLTRQGFAYDPVTKTVYLEPYKYLHNLLQMPLVGLVFLLGVVRVLLGAYRALIKACENSIWFAGPGVILTVLALFLIAGYNHTAFYPSVYDLQSSLTIENSSSSLYTLKTMTFVSFLAPVVAAYMIYAWRAINKKKVDVAELNENTHVY
jgi:cytochrome d ubiquinol oxidase subunit II